MSGSGSGPGLKMKAFSLTSARKSLSKAEIEKQKKLDADSEAAKAYEEFVATFDQDSTAIKPKTFIKGSVINPGSGEEDVSRTLYQASKLKELEQKAQTKKSPVASLFSNGEKKELQKPPLPKKSKEKEKKKSNLELFKEELKQMQMEREEKDKKGIPVSLPNKTDVKKSPVVEGINFKPIDKIIQSASGSFDTGDPFTTNIYLGNINPKMTEQQLMETFGRYGPLASVKVMWPRTDEERARNRNCGFVAFMNRKDGERALKYLNGKEIMNFEMKLGWGKAVPIPPVPVYLPPKLLELTIPPSKSGLPFNAQIPSPNTSNIKPEMITAKNAMEEETQRLLAATTVKVVIPTDRNVLQIIHRMIEFVINEGPMFEAVVMNRELNNPMFRFLFDNTSPAHIYYRWRLFSILQGERTDNWRTEEFTMFEGGSKWKPPPVSLFLQGVPDELLDLSPERESVSSPNSSSRHSTSSRSKNRDDRSGRSRRASVKSSDTKKGSLRSSQREKFEEMLRNLTPEKSAIADAMIYCIDHADAAIEIIDCITESLTISETPLHKKIARFYLVSDILHNCVVKVSNSSYYRQGFQSHLESISHGLHECFKSIEGRLKAEHFKQRVMNVFRAWEEWTVFSVDFLIKLQDIFLGLVSKDDKMDEETVNDSEIDGGVPLDKDGNVISVNEQVANQTKQSCTPKFKPSKWETVDPELIESQAMTTSKWDQLEPLHESSFNHGEEIREELPPSNSSQDEEVASSTASGEDSRGLMFLNQLHNELSEERRALLREVEVKVLKFQDELESGKRNRTPGLTIQEQLEKYRQELIQKEYCTSENKSRSRSPSNSKEPSSSHQGSSHKSKSRSPSRTTRNTTSPQRKKSRVSPSSSSSRSHHSSSSSHRHSSSHSHRHSRH